jgi:hypothetical protein
MEFKDLQIGDLLVISNNVYRVSELGLDSTYVVVCNMAVKNLPIFLNASRFNRLMKISHMFYMGNINKDALLKALYG